MARRSPLVLTPGFHGRDGLACLSRELAGVLGEHDPEQGVDVWSLGDPFTSRSEGGPVRVYGAGGSRTRLTRWVIREVAASQRDRLVVVLHAHLAPLALAFVPRGARYVHVLVGIEVWKPLSIVQTWALVKASLLVSISAHSLQGFREANPAFERREAVICHPGLPELACQPRRMDEAKEPFALIVGRMVAEERYKGHDLLLQIWSGVNERSPGARLVVVGDGDDRARLVNKAKSLELSESVHFVGNVDDGTLEDLYRRCAFFAMPSRGEGFGLVFLEAMRAGKICIGAEGAAREIIEDGVSGFIVDTDAPERVTQLIVELFQKPSLQRDMGASARKRFAALFTTAHFRERFLAAVRSCL